MNDSIADGDTQANTTQANTVIFHPEIAEHLSGLFPGLNVYDVTENKGNVELVVDHSSMHPLTRLIDDQSVILALINCDVFDLPAHETAKEIAKVLHEQLALITPWIAILDGIVASFDPAEIAAHKVRLNAHYRQKTYHWKYANSLHTVIAEAKIYITLHGLIVYADGSTWGAKDYESLGTVMPGTIDDPVKTKALKTKIQKTLRAYLKRASSIAEKRRAAGPGGIHVHPVLARVINNRCENPVTIAQTIRDGDRSQAAINSKTSKGRLKAKDKHPALDLVVDDWVGTMTGKIILDPTLASRQPRVVWHNGIITIRDASLPQDMMIAAVGKLVTSIINHPLLNGEIIERISLHQTMITTMIDIKTVGAALLEPHQAPQKTIV